ncbi:hypothetical protein LCGC14_1461260 [marine sediment metagenome]|uniref:FecR family protein n=2 Tax=root TaxID=1 RepID=A0A831VNN8_9FLAO|nr:FecR family protein [Pricia sp.]HEA21121.1 FecR family protein [Pricia antarctica]
MKDIFHISRLIIKKKLKVLTDSEKQELKQFQEDYPSLKDVEIKALADRLSGYSSIDKEKAWRAVVSKSLEKDDRPKLRLLKNSWFKYAAVFAVCLITLAYFYRNKAFDSVETTPTTVDKKIIEPGADKATLTLENGSSVFLEKGSAFQNQNANSDGVQIVYEPTKENPSIVVYNYLTVPRGGEFFLELSDNTKVWLNSESQLKYPVQFIENETRHVELVYGEAYFDVSSSTEHGGAKFKVLNLSQEVEVIGTEFNIKAYNDENIVYTTLVEGKVVVDNGNNRQPLLPSQQSSVDRTSKKTAVKEVDVYEETAWRNGVFSFRGKPLKDIMKVISRWYDVNVIFENKNLESIKFKGILSKNQDIEEILSIMKSSSINEYEITDKTIKLK